MVISVGLTSHLTEQGNEIGREGRRGGWRDPEKDTNDQVRKVVLPSMPLL
jgi:hypothetical protein